MDTSALLDRDDVRLDPDHARRSGEAGRGAKLDRKFSRRAFYCIQVQKDNSGGKEALCSVAGDLKCNAFILSYECCGERRFLRIACFAIDLSRFNDRWCSLHT